MDNNDLARRVLDGRADDLAKSIIEAADDLRYVSARLDELAAQVAGVADHDGDPGHGPSTYATIAADVQRKVISMLPNLPLSALTTQAAELDRFRITELSGKNLS